jgi:hypothetical protein
MAGFGLGIRGPTAPETRTPFAIRFGGREARAELLVGIEELLITEQIKIK